MHLTVLAVAVVMVVIVGGAIVQGSIGFGLGLLSAPIVAILIPEAIPVTLVLVGLPIGVVTAAREVHALDRVNLPWMLAAAVPGTVLGLVVLHLADISTLAAIVGAVTILGVVATALHPGVPLNRATAATAGFLGNVMGTIASVGGPPVALVFQHQRGPAIRSTLGAYFSITAVLSVIGYGVTGEITLDRILLALLLMPAMLLGAWLSVRFHPLVDRGWLRPAVLVLSGIAGAIAVLHGLL